MEEKTLTFKVILRFFGFHQLEVPNSGRSIPQSPKVQILQILPHL